MNIDTEFGTEKYASTYCFTYNILVKNFCHIRKILNESSTTGRVFWSTFMATMRQQSRKATFIDMFKQSLGYWKLITPLVICGV